MSVAEQRRAAVSNAVSKIRENAAGAEISKEVLEMIKTELLALASKRDLFTLNDFPPPTEDDPRTSCLYRLSEDENHEFALYINVAHGKVDAPPHDHTTWAVIVGVEGEEENRFYDKADSGVNQKGNAIVKEGAGVTLMPEDIHSIHIKPENPVLNFHMYGLALEQLHGRRYWSNTANEWKVFPAHIDIREAR